ALERQAMPATRAHRADPAQAGQVDRLRGEAARGPAVKAAVRARHRGVPPPHIQTVPSAVIAPLVPWPSATPPESPFTRSGVLLHQIGPLMSWNGLQFVS